MSKRDIRPWDRRKGIDRFVGITSAANTTTSITPDAAAAASSNIHAPKSADINVKETAENKSGPPFLIVDGKNYYADRFYLLKPDDEDEDKGNNFRNTRINAKINNKHSSDVGCSCGAQQAPPTLDRRKLIKSLSLKAAIVATFTISPLYLTDLFGTLPTLVLHGHKGFHTRMQQHQKQKPTHGVEHSMATGTGRSASDVLSKQDEDNRASLPKLKKQKVSNVSNKFYHAVAADSISSTSSIRSIAVKKEEEEAPEEAWFRSNPLDDEISIEIPKSTQLTQVLSAWLPPSRTASAKRNTTTTNSSKQSAKTDADKGVIEILDDSDDDDTQQQQGPEAGVSFAGIDATTVRQRRAKRGVHHPKYMLLFETSGSLVVIVSTCNLTSPKGSVDGIWVQRFFPVKKDESKEKKKMQERRMDGSDFGHVLADFLQKQSQAARVGQMLPLEFLNHYVCPSLNNDATLESCLADAYQFDTSQVHLIATVPGDHMGRREVTHCGKRNVSNGQRTFLYGPQRVHDIMIRLDSSHKTPSQSTLLKSKDDRLICQPTSLGGLWTTSDMTVLAKSYMGDNSDVPSAAVNRGASRKEVLDRMDIMWPSRNFMKSVQKGQRREKVLSEPDGVDDDVDPEDNGIVFLSSLSFNTIDVDCISRMVQYDHSYPRQLPSLRCPHFKSYARLFEGNDYNLRQKHGLGKAAELFSWFLMTSACFSRGAQGTPTADRIEDSDQVSYANFELGILFCSRLQQRRSGGGATSNIEVLDDRVYCFKPNQCTCGTPNQYGSTSSSSNNKLIHLPMPYAMRGKPYQSNTEEAHMCETPYFHEITPETACVGLMTLTPFGKARAAKQTSGTLNALPFSLCEK